MTSRISTVAWILGLAVAVVSLAGAACGPKGGSFTPVGDDAGPGGGGVDFSKIGTACTFDPATGADPTNTCPVGLACLIVTRRGEFTSGLELDFWEDQTTLYRPDGKDEGYCTLFGTLGSAEPLVCPTGTSIKAFTGGRLACMKQCQVAAECGRDGYTCDLRYADVGPICVRECSLDYPECVRTAVVSDPDNPNATLTVAAMQDLQGGAQCVDGVCNQLDPRDTGAGPGEPCDVTSDCKDLSVCIQKDLLAIPFIADSGEASGFCASACAPTAGPDACSPGFVCQEAGHLALGMDPFLMINLQDSSLFEVGGFCFRSCADGVAGNCDTAPGTACGQFDDIDVGGAWNGESMCLPDALRR